MPMLLQWKLKMTQCSVRLGAIREMVGRQEKTTDFLPYFYNRRNRAFRRRALSRSSAFLCHRQSPIQFTHSTRVSGTFTRVHVCHPFSTRTSQLQIKKMLFCFFCCEIGGFISSQSRACR